MLAQLAALVHGFPSAAHAAAAQQHANNATQAAQAGNLAGSYAEIATAISELEAAAHQAFDIGDIAQRDGDPNGKGARDGAVEALVAVEGLMNEAAAENSGPAVAAGRGRQRRIGRLNRTPASSMAPAAGQDQRGVRLPTTRAAGVEGLRFHDLRHTAATLALTAGANIRELMERSPWTAGSSGSKPLTCIDVSAGTEGLEPSTYCLEGSCSVRLSYIPLLHGP